MGEFRQPFEFVMPDKARQEPFSNFHDNLKAVAGNMNQYQHQQHQQQQGGMTSNPVSRSSSSSSNFYRSRTRTPPPLFSTVPLHFAMAPAPAPISSTTSTAGPTPITIDTDLPPSTHPYLPAPLPPPPNVSRKTSTPTPYLSPTSPSAETTTSNSPDAHYTPFGSPPRIHYNHYSSQAIDIAGGGGGYGYPTGRHEVDSPSDREGRQPISLLTAMLQQHQKILEDRMRDRQRDDIVEGEEDEREGHEAEAGDAACGGTLGLGLTNLSAAASRPSPQPIIIQSNTPRPILLPPAPSTCATSTAPTTRASSVASAVVIPATTGPIGATVATGLPEVAPKADTAPPVQVARKSSLTFAVVPQGNNAKAGPSGRRGSLEAADRAMIKNGMIAEEDEEDEGDRKTRGGDEEGKVQGSEEEGEGSEGAVEDEEADETDATNESGEENGNATDQTDEGDEQEDEEEEEEDYPIKHGSQRPSLDLYAEGEDQVDEEPAAGSEEEQGSGQKDSDEEEDQTGNASGYEEDSEAGSSSDEAVARIGSVIARFTTAMRRSPQLKHRFMNRPSVADDEDEVKETHMVKPYGHLSFVETRRPSGSRRQHDERPRFPFARPTNYRRRRADTVEDLIHGSATSLITPSSFVRIANDRSPENVKGKGQINFKQTEMPAGVRRGRSPGGSESCTRHRSPPPSQLRQAFKSRPKAASDICPPAGMSPSAGKMQMRRGVSDSPKKRRARELVANQVFALKSSKSGILKSEDDTALLSPLSKGKTAAALAPLPSDTGETSAAGGWRSDDALFAAPTVQRNTSIQSHHSGQSSILAPKPRFARPPTPLSPMRSDRSRSNPSSRPLSPYESDYPGHSGNKSASEKIVGGVLSVSRRVSETIANPFGKVEAPAPDQPMSVSIPEKATGLGPLQPSKTCRVAVDTTPAVAIAASQAEAPIQRVLHEKLAGGPSRPVTTPEYPDQLVAPLKSGYQSGPGERDLFSPIANSTGSCAIQAQRGAVTDNESTTRHRRSKPIVCPLPKANIAA